MDIFHLGLLLLRNAQRDQFIEAKVDEVVNSLD